MCSPQTEYFEKVVNTATTMNVPRTWGDVFSHREKDCPVARRILGCAVCNHDVESCTIENCALCQKKQNLPFEQGVDYVYPDK